MGTLDLSQVRAKAGGHPLRLVCFSIEGRGFLRHMVRRIAGTPALPPHHPESRVEDTPNRQSPQWVNAHTHTCIHTYIHTYIHECACAGLLLRVGRGIETKDSVALALAPPLTDAGAEIFGRKRAPRAPACGLWLQEVQYDGAASDPGGVVGGVSVTAGKLAKAVKAQRRRVKRKARKRRLGESKAEGASKGAVRKKRRALVSACLRKVQTQTTNEKSETLKPTTTEPANKASQPPDAAESARQRAERAREQAVRRRQKRMQEQTQQDEARRAAIQNLLRRTGE